MSGADTDVSQERKWAGRPVLAFFVRSAVYVVPIAASVLASVWLSKVIPAPESVWHVIGWWVAIIAGSTSVLFLVDKGVRWLLPLAALLQMTMIFPDKSPSRFRTALRSGASIKHLTAQLRAAEEAGLDDDPTRAAEIVLQLSSALNAHDPRTRGHSERVRAYSEMLAEEMGVSEEDRAKLRWASLLHDIGKLKVSPDILNKPGKLDDDEWVEIKNHPTYGAEICGPLIDWLGPWSSAIVEHHERFDGFGYPAGFAGLEIALGGRVVAVADAYDVMTTARSYKKPMPAGAAREELARHAGAQFDPDVVRAFLSLSMGRLRWVAGPLSWLAQLPFLRFAGGIQSVGTTVGVVAAATTGAAAALAGGLVSVPGVDALPLPPPPLALVEYVDTPVTTLPAVSTPVVVAGADVRPATEDAPATFGVLGNDVFLPGSALGILIPPGHGEATVNDDLTITYVPDDDFAGVDTFTYQITGPNGDTASATVTVEVGEVNDLPEANDDAATVDEDDSVIVDVLANDTDTEGLDPSSVTVGSGPVSGTVTIDPVTGVVTYTPDTDFAGSDAFIYTVADTDGVLVTATVTITVTPINDPPVAVNDSASTDEEVTALIAVLGNDSDIEGGLVPGSVTMSVSPSNGTTTVSGGAVSYTPDPDFNGVDSFGYQVCDDAAACDTATVTVTVNPINDPPIVPGPGPLATDEDVPISFDPLAAASDVDGDALTVSTFDATTTAGGTVVLGSLEYHPPADWSGDDSFTYTVTDGTDSVVIAVTITVNPVNDPPAGTPPALAGTEDTPIILDPLVGFTDAEGDPISLDSLDAVSAAGGTLTYAAGLITYTPADDHNGTDTFTYILTDGTDTTTIPVTITLTPTNDTPVLDPIGPSAIDEGVLLSFVVTASDVELPGDALTFSLSGEPTGAAINATTGVFTWTPTEVQGPGAYLLDVVVTDDRSPVLSDTETITVTVNDVNTVPVLDPVGNQVVDEGVLLGFTATATDADLPANSLTFSLSGAPPGASINPTTGAFTWTPTEAQGAGAYLFDVVVTDDGSPNLAASELILVTVDEVNIAPVLDPVGNRVVDETVLLSFTATATATDADLLANTLTFSLSGAPAGAAINPSSGAFTWTPTEAQGAGAYVFDVVVTDDGTPNLADSETITVTVNEINLAPVLDPVGNQVVNEGALLSFTATASDADLVANTLTFSLSFTPAGASINPTTGVFTWTPTAPLVVRR